MTTEVVLTGICLALALAPEAEAFIPGERFTLAWTHSIEKVRWEEDYAVRRDAAGTGLRLIATAARVRGSGAGMEPPEGARLVAGWYEYQPVSAPRQPLQLSRSGYAPDYELCAGTACRPLAHWLESDGGITLMTACERSSPRPGPGE